MAIPYSSPNTAPIVCVNRHRHGVLGMARGGWCSRRSYITVVSCYDTEYPLPVAFPPQSITSTLAEWLITRGIRRACIAGLSSPTPTILFVQGLMQPTPWQRWKSTRASRSSSTAAVEKQFENEKQHMVHRFKS
ncbi:hypothetical protein BD779DRAFT_534920 [Infundibulicybe gibba]|nr:hypothetical protein BD779DRAFT_534920 [Infundibulicybe gibba]